MKQKFSLQEVVCLFTNRRQKMWVDTVTIRKGYITYLCWDGNTSYNEYEEWQLEKYEPVTE